MGVQYFVLCIRANRTVQVLQYKFLSTLIGAAIHLIIFKEQKKGALSYFFHLTAHIKRPTSQQHAKFIGVATFLKIKC
jgi:hypothetical protein